MSELDERTVSNIETMVEDMRFYLLNGDFSEVAGAAQSTIEYIESKIPNGSATLSTDMDSLLREQFLSHTGNAHGMLQLIVDNKSLPTSEDLSLNRTNSEGERCPPYIGMRHEQAEEVKERYETILRANHDGQIPKLPDPSLTLDDIETPNAGQRQQGCIVSR